MNVLILHRIPYSYMRYADTIDHSGHAVFYVGPESALENIPSTLRCTRLVRPGRGAVFQEVIDAVSAVDVKFDMVVSLSEYELMDAARVREHLGVPGPAPQQVAKVRDKAVMKRCVAAAGIAVPQFALLERWAGGNWLDLKAERSVILKPVDGASANDVVRFDSQQGLARALRDHATGVPQLDRREPRLEGFEVEEFVSGDVLHIDGFVKDGQIRVIVGSRYINTLLDFANGKPSGSVQMALSDQTVRWVETVLRAVEISRGAFHLEVFDSPDGLVFLEIANRSGGARIAETFKLQTGVHLPTAELAVLVDPDFDVQPHLDQRYKYAWFIFPGHHFAGKYCRVAGHEFVRGAGEVLCLNELPPDVELKAHISYMESEIPLAGLLRSESAGRLTGMLRDLFERVQIDFHDQPPIAADKRAMAL